jgi:DNA polymerase-1
VTSGDRAALADWLRGASVAPGTHVGLVAHEDAFVVALADGRWTHVAVAELPDAVARAHDAVRPRWTWWDIGTASAVVRAGAHVATCWDVAAVHRVLAGGWRADPARAWARAHDLDPHDVPAAGPRNLFDPPDDGDPDSPVRADGHLDPEWAAGGWARTAETAAAWASLAVRAAVLQQRLLETLGDRPAAPATARAESAAELLCAELGAEGLPIDRRRAEQLVAEAVGTRPRSQADADAARRARDQEVLRHAPPGATADLRNPAQVRALLRRIGVEVDDTRAWRLESLRHTHPLIDALLTWRKAERIATTYGYAWLDTHVGPDDRLRGVWSGADGAAGRMTASAGLHNLPADLRSAVRAEPGHVLVCADLGQIEPRVLAAISGDAALAHATREADLYLPVARALDVDRATAKVAVLGAMYGQTTGHGARALHRLEAAYPVAMRLLHDADTAAQRGEDLRTHGGRLVRMSGTDAVGASDAELRRRAAARGRYGRNAVVQGAAAELFKVWAVLVRARAREHQASIVLCLHDELVVHTPAQHGAAVADVVTACLQEAAQRWSPTPAVRFVVDARVVERWSDAKGPDPNADGR